MLFGSKYNPNCKDAIMYNQGNTLMCQGKQQHVIGEIFLKIYPPSQPGSF